MSHEKGINIECESRSCIQADGWWYLGMETILFWIWLPVRCTVPKVGRFTCACVSICTQNRSKGIQVCTRVISCDSWCIFLLTRYYGVKTSHSYHCMNGGVLILLRFSKDFQSPGSITWHLWSMIFLIVGWSSALDGTCWRYSILLLPMNAGDR